MSVSSFSDFDSSNHPPRKRGDLRRAKKTISKAIQELEHIGYIVELLEDGGAVAPPTERPPAPAPRVPVNAAPIISRYSIVFLGNGKGRLTLDDREPFTVPPFEAQVFCYLVKNDSQDPGDIAMRDHLVDFKSLETQLLPAARSGGRECSERAMVERISRLRGFLVKAGFDERVIEYEAGSYRLRVRRQPPTLFAENG
jgi:hypothetical protein